MKFFNLKKYFKEKARFKSLTRSSYFDAYLKKISVFTFKKRVFLTLLFLALLISDLAVLQLNQILLPEKKLPRSSSSASRQNLKHKQSNAYSLIWQKNLFHEGPILEERIGTASLYQQTPEKSSLPFDLTGTIVHVNPQRSVATVKVNNESQSYQIGEIIDKKAELSRIERRRIVFFNKDNSLLEYIEIPEIDKITIQQSKPKTVSTDSSSIIKQVKVNNFSVKRSDINSYLKNLPEILSQARVIPNRVRENGNFLVKGFRFASIKKDSIFEKLGFELGDTIKEVNGEEVNTPEKALQLFEKLRNSSNVKLLVEKDGKDVEYEYNVSEDAPVGN